MCTYPVQPICTFSCTSVFFINIYYPQYTVLHILSHCTSYTFYFIICSLFHSHLYLYTYSLVLCSLFYCLCYFYFLFYYYYVLFFCTFHWADLSRPTFHYWLYPVWLCMWQIIKNPPPPLCSTHLNDKGTCSVQSIQTVSVPRIVRSKYKFNAGSRTNLIMIKP